MKLFDFDIRTMVLLLFWGNLACTAILLAYLGNSLLFAGFFCEASAVTGMFDRRRWLVAVASLVSALQFVPVIVVLVLVSASRILHQGRPAVMAFLTDISDRVQREAERDKLISELTQAVRDKEGAERPVADLRGLQEDTG